MKSTFFSSRTFFKEMSIQSLCLCIILFMMCGCDRYAIIPAKTKFTDDIWFSERLYKEDGKVLYKDRPYLMVNWSKEGTPDASTTPPFGVEVNGKKYAPQDFLFENFSKCGAHDNRKSKDDLTGKESLNEDLHPILTLVDDSSNTRISCDYTKDKMLKSIKVWIEYNGDKTDFAQREVKIVARKGIATLPANYETLVETLGEPLEHIPQHMYNVDRPFED